MLKYYVKVSHPIKSNSANESFHQQNYLKYIYMLSVQAMAQLFNPSSAHVALCIQYPIAIQSMTFVDHGR